ncbi:MAG: hypothetical protein JO250_22195 [Armatimonadetes bacterium]|nr:hypothetical protein [Armatimonadota bacterium]
MYRSIPISYRMADAFFRNRWLFLIAFLVVSGVTMGTLYLRSKTYQATALTQVITQDVAAALGEREDTGWVSPAQKNVNQLDVLLNGDFLGTALSNAKLGRPINTDPRAEDSRYALLRKKLSTNAQSDNLFSISLTWDSPSEAEEIVRAIQSQYIQEIGQERYAQTNATLAFLDSQIGDYAQRLRKAEKLLTDYKRTNPGQLPEAQSADIGQLSALQAQLDNMKITAHDSAAQKTVLEQRLAQIKPQSIMEQTAAPSPLNIQINEMKAQRDKLLTHMLPTHPVVQDMDAQIAALEKERDGKLKAGAAEAQDVTHTKLQDNPEWQALHQQLVQATIEQQTQAMQMGQLAQKIAQYQERVKNIPAEQRALTDKTRDYKVVQAQYDSLLQRREQVQMEGNLARVSASSSLSPIGYIHAEPTTGRTKMIVMFVGSLVLGLIIGLVLVVLSEWADRSLRYGTDAERALGVPVLAVVPDAADLRLPPPAEDRRPGGLRRLLAASKKQDVPETDQESDPVRDRPALDAPAVPAMNASAEGAQS